MPLPSTRVFPPGWSEHHRPVASDTMTARCSITRSGAPIHAGACRVIAERADNHTRVGDQDLQSVRYLITIRYDVNDVEVGDVLQVTDAVDGGLIGRTFVVTQVRYSSQQWERDLYCEDEIAQVPVLSDEVTVVRAPLVSGYGNSLVWDWDNAARVTVPAALTPASSSEQTGARDDVTTFYRCQVPPATDVLVTDRIEWGGRTWEVDGEPRPMTHPLTGAPHHVEIALRSDEGG